MAQHWKSSDAGNSDKPKRDCTVLPLREKVKLLNRKKKITLGEAKIHCKNECSVHEKYEKGKRNLCEFCCYIPKCKSYGHSI